MFTPALLTYTRAEVAALLDIAERSIHSLLARTHATKGVLVDTPTGAITAESLLAEINRRLDTSGAGTHSWNYTKLKQARTTLVQLLELKGVAVSSGQAVTATPISTKPRALEFAEKCLAKVEQMAGALAERDRDIEALKESLADATQQRDTWQERALERDKLLSVVIGERDALCVQVEQRTEDPDVPESFFDRLSRAGVEI